MMKTKNYMLGLFLLMIMILMANNLEATNYYFSPTGNDSLDGTSNATAWKTLSKLTSIPFTGGEIVCFNTGNYNTEDQRAMYMTNATTDVLFTTCSPGQSVNITGFEEAYNVTPNTKWTNISYGGMNIWNTSISGLGTNNIIVQFLNGSEFINSECWNTTRGTCDTTTPDWFTKYGNNFYRVFANSTSDEVAIIMANGENPNNVALYISTQDATFRYYYANNTGKLIIRGLNFYKHKRALDLSYSTNTLIENCTFDEGYNSINYRYGRTAVNTTNTIRYNTFLGNHYGVFYGDWIKGAMEESDPIFIRDNTATNAFYVPFHVYGNIFNGTAGGISLGVQVPASMCGSQIYDNYFDMSTRGGYESTFEIEEYCCNSSWYNNTQIGGQLASVSFGPANSSAGMCHFVYNKIKMNDTLVQNSSLNYETYAVKAYDNTGDGTLVTDWNISYNTFISKGRTWWSGIETAVELKRNIVTNNIFISNTSDSYEVIDTTGTDANGNFWDYNLYYQAGNGNLLRTYMNDSSIVEYANLTLAKGASVWDGEWDVHSLEVNPLLYDNFTPMSDSVVCGAGEDGTDIGAMICVEVPAEPEPETPGTIECSDSQNSTILWIIIPVIILGIFMLFIDTFSNGVSVKTILIVFIAGTLAVVFLPVIMATIRGIC